MKIDENRSVEVTNSMWGLCYGSQHLRLPKGPF